MTFVHPLLLGGLALVGIPVLIHLIMRQKPKRLPFPAFRFLVQKHRTNQTRLRLRQLLLLLLRMAIIAALCLALVRPALTSGVLSPLAPDRPVSAVLLIDTSYSMEYAVSDKTRLDEARRRANELLDELPDGSQVAVLDSAEVGGQPQPIGQARDRIAGLKLRHDNAPLTRQIERAYAVFPELDRLQEHGAEAPRVLYVFSDRTHGCWDEAAAAGLRPPPGITSVFVDVGVDDPADLAIVEVKPEPTTVRPGGTVRINVTLQATGADYDAQIVCGIDGLPGKEKSQKVQAGGTEVVTFEYQAGRGGADESPEVLSEGLHQIDVRLKNSDAMKFDNAGFATFRVLGSRPLLVIADDTEAARDWAEVVAGRFRATVKSTKELKPDQLDLDNYAAVCLFNVAKPEGWLWTRLKDHVAEGHGLAVILGGQKGGPNLAAYNDDKSAVEVMPVRLSEVRWVAGEERFWSEFQDDGHRLERHPLLASFLDDKRKGNITYFVDHENRPWVQRFWKVRPEGQADVLIHYTDKEDSPALIERTIGRGNVLVLTTALEVAPGEWFKLTDAKLTSLRGEGVPDAVLTKLAALKNKEFETRDDFAKALAGTLDKAEREQNQKVIEGRASRGPWYQFTDAPLSSLRSAGLPEAILTKLATLKGRPFDSRRDLLAGLTPDERERFQNLIVSRAELVPWNNFFGGKPFGFVLSNRMFQHLAGDTKEPTFNYITGQTVPVPVPTTPFLPTYTLAGPGVAGGDATLTRQKEQRELTITRATTPGNFLVLAVPDEGQGVQRLAAFSMNPRPDEYRLDRVPVEQIEALLGEGSVLPVGRTASLRDRLQERGGRPLELMPWLLVALLVFLALESLLANRFYRQPAPDEPVPSNSAPESQASLRPVAQLAEEGR
jgi:Aerotolerance regulator N-terminal